ncbi:MAG: hypothetical protein ACREJ4_04065, partial [Candidatus Methylomirabilaceae bacterium]
QNRTLWNRERMRLGAEWLARSATGEVFSRFHAEAGIAAEHCFAPSFGQTCSASTILAGARQLDLPFPVRWVGATATA